MEEKRHSSKKKGEKIYGISQSIKSSVSNKKQRLLQIIIEKIKYKKGNGISRNSIRLLQTRYIKFSKRSKNKVTTQMWGDHFEYQTQETIYPNVFKFTTSVGTYVITIISNKMNPSTYISKFHDLAQVEGQKQLSKRATSRN